LSSHRTNSILHLSADIGQTILENGGETYRAQETMDRIAKAYDMVECGSFVVPTGIMGSITDLEGNTLSINRRITHRTINLEKVAAVNAIARSLETAPIDPESARRLVRGTENITHLTLIKALILSAIISAFFTLVFKGGLQEFIVSLLTGVAVRLMLTASRQWGFGDFFGNVTGGIVAALIPLIFTRIGFLTQYDAVIIGAIMLLVPGITIVNAIRDTIAGDFLSGTSRAIEAFVLTLGIAIGTGITLKLWYLLQ